jgi:signal transduction histidine kinase
MLFPEFARSPRRLLALYLTGAVAAVACLAWLGWRLLDQEKAVEAQRASARLEVAADQVVRVFQRGLDDLNRAVTAPGEQPPAGTVLLIADHRSARATPPGRLAFYPVAPESPVVRHDLFRAGETAEFAEANPVKAIAAYRQLADSPVADVRAGSLLRLGRSLRKARRHAEALVIYGQLALLGDLPVEGGPAELVAREGRCSTLEEAGPASALQTEAQALYRDLASGKWMLARASWEFHVEEAGAWAGPSLAPSPGEDEAKSASAAAESLWTGWHDQPSSGQAASGQAVSGDDAHPVLAVWRSTDAQLTAALAGREYLDALRRKAGTEAGVDLALVNRDGRAFLGRVSGPQATRSSMDARLPFTVRVSSANPSLERAEASTRRRLLLLTLVIVSGLILGSTYFTVRGVARELAAARLQSEFVSAVSHEFRTPLTSLRQLSQMLLHGRVISEDRRYQYYGVLVRESERLHRLVETLLTFGRAEAGNARYRLEPVDLAEVVRTVVEEFRRHAADFQLEMSIGASPCPVQGERELLSVALWNLLDNAAKYSPECRTIWVSLWTTDTRVELSVRDGGIGIPRDEQQRVFTRFVRGAHTDSSTVKGTGIGLALVRHAAQAHGGDVRLESDPGAGSTFTVELPRGN